MSARKIQERIQHSEHGESLKWRIIRICLGPGPTIT